jgi:hypothetical protein
MNCHDYPSTLARLACSSNSYGQIADLLGVADHAAGGGRPSVTEAGSGAAGDRHQLLFFLVAGSSPVR